MTEQDFGVRLSVAEGVATITLDDPASRNAMTPAMGESMARCVARLRDDSDVRVVILTGAGKSFSSGGDLSMLARDAGLPVEGEAPSMEGSPRDFYARFLSLRSLPMPTIAAINGAAIGAGLCIALACDLRIASTAARMGLTFSRLGIHPGMGATYFLPRLVGTARACDLLFTGRLFDAAEAERIGLVQRVAPAEELEAAARAWAAEIAAAGPVAVRLMKRAIYRGSHHTLDEMLEFESLQQSFTFGTADAREGVSAVMEKRTPQFRGQRGLP